MGRLRVILISMLVCAPVAMPQQQREERREERREQRQEERQKQRQRARRRERRQARQGTPQPLTTPPWAGIIDPSRAIDWRGAGCCININTGAHSAIPTNRTQCQIPAGALSVPNSTLAALVGDVNRYVVSNTIVPSGKTDVSDATTINAALMYCSSQPNTYVLLGQGLFYNVNGITFGGSNNTNGWTTIANNITLRGSGADKTVLRGMSTGGQDCSTNANAICISGGLYELINNSNYPYGGGCSWTAGYAQGTTTLTVSGCVYKAGNAFPQAGQIIFMDQRNDDIQLSGCTSIGTSATCTSTLSPLPPEYVVGACVGVSLGGALSASLFNVPGYYNTTLLQPKLNPNGTVPGQPGAVQSCTATITAVSQGPPATFSYTLFQGAGTNSNLPSFTTCNVTSPSSQTSGSCYATVDTGGVFVGGVTGVNMPGNLTNGRQCPDLWFNGSNPGGGRGWMTTCQGSAGASGNELSYRSEVQLARIASVTQTDATSGTITIDAPGIYATNYRASRAPGIWWYSSYRHDVGVEALTLDGTFDGGNTGGGTINVVRCYNCWIRGLRLIAGSRNHIWMQSGSWHDTVRDSYFYGTKRGSSQSYGIELFDGTGDLLLENNMFVNGGTLLMNGGTTGTVFSYNLIWNDNGANVFYLGGSNYPQHDLNGFNLLEGNDAVADVFDNIHGTMWGPTTFFRERLRGQQVVYKVNNLTTFKASAFNRFPNIIGSVLGTAGVQSQAARYHPLIDANNCGGSISAASIYCTDGDSQSGNKIADDVLVSRGMFRWGNYDTISGGVRWCDGSGSQPSFCTSAVTPGNTTGSEIPGAFPYLNAQFVPASHTLPASFYYSSQPAWFVTPWGTPPWPPIGPDVVNGNAPDGTCWTGWPSNPALVQPQPAGLASPCLDAGAGMANALPSQLAHANMALDPAFEDPQPVTSATYASNVVTLIGQFTGAIGDPALVKGVTPAGYNGTFQIITNSGPTVDIAPPYISSNVAAGGSVPPGSYNVVITRVNPNGETTKSGESGGQTTMTVPSTCGNTPPTGNCTIVVPAVCGTVPPIATNPGYGGSCKNQGWGPDASTGWNLYLKRVNDLSGKYCRQNATPLPYAQNGLVTTLVTPDGANGPCIEPPLKNTAWGTTVTVSLYRDPGGSGSGGTLTAPTVQTFNADNYYGTGTPPPQQTTPSTIKGNGKITGQGKIT